MKTFREFIAEAKTPTKKHKESMEKHDSAADSHAKIINQLGGVKPDSDDEKLLVDDLIAKQVDALKKHTATSELYANGEGRLARIAGKSAIESSKIANKEF